MKLFAHKEHWYRDYERHCDYSFLADTYREVPDEVGRQLLSVHTSKFCDVSDDSSPSTHRCPKTSTYQREDMGQAPSDRMMTAGKTKQPRARHALSEEYLHRFKAPRMGP